MARKPADSKNSSVIDRTARATQSIAETITGRRKGSEGISIHVHVGDLFLIGFDEAIDAEEWGAREVNNDGSGRGAAGRQQLEPERKTKRRLSFRKGNVEIRAEEDAEPTGKARNNKRRTPVRAKKKASRKRR